MRLTRTESEQLDQVRRDEAVYVEDLISKDAAHSLVKKDLLYCSATGYYRVSHVKWNNVILSLGELYEAYYASVSSYSEDNMHDALDRLMTAYSEWLD